MMLRISLLVLLLGPLLACSAPVQKTVRPDQLDFPALEFDVPAIEQTRLSNGIRVYLLEDQELPLVEVTAMIGAGSISDPVELDGRGELFAGLLQDGGAGERGPKELEDYLEGLAIDFGVATDTYMTTIDLSLPKEDVAAGLRILDDVLRRPRFDAKRLELLRRQMLENIRRRDDNPGSIASRVLNETIYADHPFGRTSTVESVSAITRDDLRTFHRRHFTPDNLWLAISGDFDRESMLAELEKLFVAWQPADHLGQPLPMIRPGLEPGIRVFEKDVSQTTIRLGHLGISKDNPDLHAIRVMNFILGGGGFNSRMLREIRSNRGLAYSVYSYFKIGRKLPGSFIAGSETKCASTVEVVRLMLDEIERIRTGPVSAEELALAKESRINSFVFAFTDSHQVLTQQVRLDYFNYPEDYLKTYRDKIAALTREDILRVAREYLKPDRLVIVLVGRSAEFGDGLDSLGRPVFPVPTEKTAAGIKE
ncbi:MAG: insulinase family protein [Desulfuromonas sp.]|mgnify:CR=1 FL=1|nr:MAG: insulinase family protein [Desulfuromonas sp.]